MELRVLRYFLAVAQEESISGAAEYLHLTQPTLSRQLMELEEELGKQLFIRGKRRVTLTEDGVLLRKRAGEIIGLVDKMSAEISEDDSSVGGDIYIGSGETDAIRLIARTAQCLHRNYPGIRYHLYSGNADDVTERLDKGLLDFGILIEPVDLKKYDYLPIPCKDTWGLLMRRDHPLAEKDAISPSDLEGLPLITSRQTLTNQIFSDWLGFDFNNLNIVATYNLVFNSSLMVSEGFGCALTLDKLVNTGEGSGLCFRPLDPPLKVGMDIVWKKYQMFSRASEIFLTRLKEKFSEETDK